MAHFYTSPKRYSDRASSGDRRASNPVPSLLLFSQKKKVVLVKKMAKDVGVTEELKRRDQLAWVAAMNNIRDRVNEIVLNEVIFV